VLSLLPARDRKAAPWKNGGGVTHEVIAWPADADLVTFDWRISLAVVDRDGPFSTFVDVDRQLAVLSGCMVLDIDGREFRIDAGGPPVSFAGDVPTAARIVRGPVADLNIMTRRGRIRATLEKLELCGQQTVHLRGPAVVVCRTSSLRIDDGARIHHLGFDDAAFASDDEAARLAMRADGPVYLVRLRPAGPDVPPR
jgi:hypothetical protein